MRNFLTVFFSGALLFLGFLQVSPVSADEGDFSISPLFTEVSFDGGNDGEHAFSIEVSNRTKRDAEIHLSVVDFGTLDESGGIAFLGGGGDFERRYGLASWIALQNETVIVPAGGTESVRGRIENRESLFPGGHYGAVLFELGGAQGSVSEGSLVSLRPSFASLFFVKKTGGEAPKLEFSDVFVRDRNLFGIPDRLSIRFRNSGNTHLVPRGIALVRDPLGRVVRKGILNTESGRILPESYRAYSVALKPVAAAIFPGRYSVSIEYRYDGSDDFVAAPEKRVFPIALLLLWSFGIIAAIFSGAFSVRAFRKRLSKRKRSVSKNSKDPM